MGARDRVHCGMAFRKSLLCCGEYRVTRGLQRRQTWLDLLHDDLNVSSIRPESTWRRKAVEIWSVSRRPNAVVTTQNSTI